MKHFSSEVLDIFSEEVIIKDSIAIDSIFIERVLSEDSILLSYEVVVYDSINAMIQVSDVITYAYLCITNFTKISKVEHEIFYLSDDSFGIIMCSKELFILSIVVLNENDFGKKLF